MIDALQNFWDDIEARWRVLIIFVAVLIVLVMISGWADSWHAWRETRALQRQAKVSLEKAAVIASTIAKREKELERLEEQRNEKTKELDSLSGGVRHDRDVYDRAVAEPRTDQPTAAELCRELDALGYSCYR